MSETKDYLQILVIYLNLDCNSPSVIASHDTSPNTGEAKGLYKKIASPVVFESLYREGVEIATHSDIEDEGQTVRIVAPKSPVPQTGDTTNLGFRIGLAAFALGGLIAVVIIYFKAKKDDE